jgi:flagellar hook assembly protein FlgD
LTLGTVTAGGGNSNITLSVDGALSQNSLTAISGANLTITAGGAVSLSTVTNSVNSLVVTAAGTVQFTNSGALTLGDVTGGSSNDITLSVGGTVSQNPGAAISGDGLTITASGAVTLDNSANSVTGLNATGAGVTFKNTGVLGITGISSSAAVDVEAGGAITISGSGIDSTGNDVTVTTTAGNITVSDAVNAGPSGDVYLKAAVEFVLDGSITGDTVTLEKGGTGGITQNTGGIINAGTLEIKKTLGLIAPIEIEMTQRNNVAAFIAADAGGNISFFNDRLSNLSTLTVNAVKGNARVEIKEASGSLKVTGPIEAKELELGAKVNITIDNTPGFSQPGSTDPPEKITFALEGILDRDSASVNPFEKVKAEKTITIKPFEDPFVPTPASSLAIAINDTRGSSPLSISQALMNTLEASNVIVGDKATCSGTIYVGNDTTFTPGLTVGGYNFSMQTQGDVIISNHVQIGGGKELHIVAETLRLDLDPDATISPNPNTGDLTILLEINGLLTSSTNTIDAGSDGTIQIHPVSGQSKPIRFGDMNTPAIIPSPGAYFYYCSAWTVQANSYIIGKLGYDGDIYVSGVSNATCELTVINDDSDNYIYFHGLYNSANKSLKLTTSEIRFLGTTPGINIGTAGLILDQNLYLMPHDPSQTAVASITAGGDIIITKPVSGSPGPANSLTIINGAGKTWIGGPVDLSGNFSYTGSSVTFVAIPSPGTPPPETALTPSDPPVELKAGGTITFDTPRIDGNIVVNGYITAALGQDLPFYGNLTFAAGLAGAAKNIDNSAWLVFAGDREQRFDSGGSVNPMGNIRIEKTGGAKVLTVNHDVIQKTGAELYIKSGLLNLTETVPSTDPLKTWTMGTPLGPVDPGTFTGISGRLSLGDDSGTGAGLKAVDIDFQGSLGLSAAGVHNTIAATGNITIVKNTAGSAVKDFENLPVVMFPDGTAEVKKISAQEELGTLIILRPALVDQHLNVKHMQLGALGYTELGAAAPADYKTGIYLNAAGSGAAGLTKITVHGNWTNHVVDVNNTADNITTAFRGIGEVVFDSAANPDKVVTITGNSAWYAFTCVSPGVTIKFDNYPKRHYISGRFTLNGGENVGDYIILTRLNDTPGEPACKPGTTQPVLPLEEEEHKKFWDFVVAPKTIVTPGTVMNLSNLIIMFSNASLRLVIPPKDKHVWAYPYFSPSDPYDPANPGFVYTPGLDDRQYSYYNINWIFQYSFFYAYTEDANGNGRIDRIRAQAAFELNASDAGAFDGLEIKVKIDEAAEEEWISVKGYGPVPNSPASIYIYLEEHEYADGGAEKLFVDIENNETLMDLATGLSPIQGSVLTTDTVFPRITYALMLPGSNKAFVQFSEEIDDSVIEFNYPPYPPLGREQIVPVDGKKNEFELTFPAGSAYDVKTLASGIEFTVKGVKDNAKWAVDRNTDDPDIPSPKYPKDVKYSDYVTVPGNPEEWTAPPAVTVLYPPNGLPVPGGFPNGELSHRITDILVSLPPAGVQPPVNDPFFVWPVWAINPQEKDSITEPRQDIHVVRKFAGHDYLEDKDITLEVNMNEAFVGTHAPQLVFRAAVPDTVKAGSAPVDPRFGVPHGNVGLWLNSFESRTYPNNERPDLSPMPESPYAFSNLVPKPYGLAYIRPADSESSNGRVFDFKLLKTAASEYTYGVSILEFFLRLSPVNNPYTNPFEDPSEYLYIGQLGEGAKPWYRRMAPFKLEIHNITRQRSGVTILNNVIKPSAGEKVYLDYQLSRNGPVTIQVFTLDGTLVKVLVRENKNSGEYRADWDGKNNGGREVARGMYFIRVVAPDIDEIRKVMVVK